MWFEQIDRDLTGFVELELHSTMHVQLAVLEFHKQVEPLMRFAVQLAYSVNDRLLLDFMKHLAVL